MTIARTVTKRDLIEALKDIDDDTIIGANHTTAEIYAEDETGRPRLVFSFFK